MSNKLVLKISSAVLVLSASFIPVAASALTGMTSGSAQLFLGAKALDSYWEPADEQGEIGIQFDFRNEYWPFGFTFGLYSGSGESDPAGIMETETTELQFGLKKTWDVTPAVHFNLGGGLTFASLEVSSPPLSVTEKDTGLGVWFSGAVYWTIGQNFDLGLQMMASGAEGEYVFGTETAEIGGGHFGFIVGTHW